MIIKQITNLIKKIDDLWENEFNKIESGEISIEDNENFYRASGRIDAYVDCSILIEDMLFSILDNKEYQDSVENINNMILRLKKKGESVKGVSDKWHTFEELYYHRMILFSIILNMNKDISWKAKKHHDGTMFDDDSFICGIETPEGQYTYHYNLEHWDMFDVKELEFAPEYDGHKPSDITRLLTLI